MKKERTNVFTIPAWMKNLRAHEPSGTRTPDQVASSLELSILIHGPDKDLLEEIILKAVPTVPLKRQPFLQALLKGDVVANCQAFIDQVNTQLAQLPQEIKHVERQPETEPVCTGGESRATGHTAIPEWEDDDSDLRRKPSSRGLRALRAAKRQSAEA